MFRKKQRNEACIRQCEDACAQAVDTDSALPSYARTLSWLSLVVILLTSLGLSFFISNSARETLLTRQENFAQQLVENLNSQIFRRFALPTLLGYGRIALRQPEQYDRLDQVVKSVIHGLPVERLRIYDFSRLVAYSTKKEDLGRAGLSPPYLDDILQGGAPRSEIISTMRLYTTRVPSGDRLASVLYVPFLLTRVTDPLLRSLRKICGPPRREEVNAILVPVLSNVGETLMESFCSSTRSFWKTWFSWKITGYLPLESATATLLSGIKAGPITTLPGKRMRCTLPLERSHTPRA